jgi:hypothetical protein
MGIKYEKEFTNKSDALAFAIIKSKTCDKVKIYTHINGVPVCLEMLTQEGHLKFGYEPSAETKSQINTTYRVTWNED